MLYFGNTHWLGSQSACLSASRSSNGHGNSISNSNSNSSKTYAVTGADYEYAIDYRVAIGKIHFEELLPSAMIFAPTFHFGLCVPRACSNQDLFTLTREYFLHNFTDTILPTVRIQITELKRVQSGDRSIAALLLHQPLCRAIL